MLDYGKSTFIIQNILFSCFGRWKGADCKPKQPDTMPRTLTGLCLNFTGHKGSGRGPFGRRYPVPAPFLFCSQARPPSSSRRDFLALPGPFCVWSSDGCLALDCARAFRLLNVSNGVEWAGLWGSGERSFPSPPSLHLPPSPSTRCFSKLPVNSTSRPKETSVWELCIGVIFVCLCVGCRSSGEAFHSS